MRYPLGQPVRIDTGITDLAGAPVDPTTLTLTVRGPTGVDTPYTWAGGQIVRDALGKFHRDHVPDATGRWAYAWTSTGPGAGVATGAFDVVDPLAPALLTLEDARAQTNKRQVTADDDAELLLHVDAASGWLDRHCGPVVPRTVVEQVSPLRAGLLMLTTTPVLAVVSATQSGGTVDVSGWTVGGRSGLVATGGWSGSAPVAITYRAGRDPIPAELLLAARALVGHLWELQRGRTRAAGDDGGYGLAGFAIPNRVRELIADHELLPGIA